MLHGGFLHVSSVCFFYVSDGREVLCNESIYFTGFLCLLLILFSFDFSFVVFVYCTIFTLVNAISCRSQ
jgi:hypothetical protein